jgi:hypothetical protein
MLMVLFSVQTYAQENSTYQKSQMAKELGLDSEVAKQFDSINKNYKTEINTLRIKSSSKKNLKKLTALEEKRDEELQNLLTKEQFETYVEFRRKERENMRSLIRKKQ